MILSLTYNERIISVILTCEASGYVSQRLLGCSLLVGRLRCPPANPTLGVLPVCWKPWSLLCCLEPPQTLGGEEGEQGAGETVPGRG